MIPPKSSIRIGPAGAPARLRSAAPLLCPAAWWLCVSCCWMWQNNRSWGFIPKPFLPEQLRAAAHRIADMIYEKLTGDVGVFSTRIAYVVKQGKKYSLQVADADGFNAQPVIEYTEPIISPAWSPDGTQLAYVSFENKKPVVYVQTLATQARKAAANFRGSNSAPEWSPDGKKLAVVLSLVGGSQIFLINADGSGLQRLTQSSGIDTEPSFSPDGRYIIFTSDRGGSPQIYRMPITGSASSTAERLTFEGSYNVSPHYSPDGKSFTFIHRNGDRFNVAIQESRPGRCGLSLIRSSTNPPALPLMAR